MCDYSKKTSAATIYWTFVVPIASLVNVTQFWHHVTTAEHWKCSWLLSLIPRSLNTDVPGNWLAGPMRWPKVSVFDHLGIMLCCQTISHVHFFSCYCLVWLQSHLFWYLWVYMNCTLTSNGRQCVCVLCVYFEVSSATAWTQVSGQH